VFTSDHLYVIADSATEYDPVAAWAARDGVIAPVDTAVFVLAGTPAGVVDLELVFLPLEGRLPDVPRDVVAAACDIHFPSGSIDVRSWDHMLVERRALPSSRPCRVLVTVKGRDDAFNGAGVPEVHRVWVAQAPAPTPRWRSMASDAVAGHLGP